ncbi:TrbG/VirB9 family P-type conjugative transfer protein [Asticcacaulis sp. EMRT-3]|uniref:TrbG/VirB9 family P-type conjugative transfer protein n=1 Tax=Asticcacaulis sp. EMRT-3 TaxID=3040349 RepID=UPI0024AF4EB1|nr:TrbG/VirB9 family P-type conjugative transfer protein [Asticcacaulis sp. EMRT-3]MDI7776571.1 TrbG/VirB9 family P-type conjugative transfer protein [Asticcacaulis sp. EMRT-3]
MKFPLASCVLIAALGLTTPTLAADIPTPGGKDLRVRYVTYNKDEVTVVAVAVGTATRIVLGDDEKIEVAATGMSADCQSADSLWCIRADQGTNEVWVKPKPGATHNNLELRTNRHDYSIEFTLHGVARARRRSAGSSPMYRVIFRYPIQLPPMSTFMAGTVAMPKDDEAAVLSDRLAADQPSPRNWKYSKKVGAGAEDISPALVFDDGRFTYLKFPANRDIPTVFYIAPSGEEERVNFHMDGDLLVVERTGKRFVLRLGRSVVGIWNDAFDANGVAPKDGTTVAGVQREVKP